MYNHFEQSIQEITDLDRYQTIHQERPAETVSEKYQFISTSRVLAVLQDFGWFPVKVDEARTRIAAKQGFQKHALRLANREKTASLAVCGTMPQLLLTNSHSGSAAFSLDIALFEKVCSNGLLVPSYIDSLTRVAHRGYTDEKVANALKLVEQELPATLTAVEQFQAVQLDTQEQHLYAESAVELAFDGEKYAVNSSELLFARRSAQRPKTLWNTFNVVQEAVIRGGVRQQRRDGSRIRSREVKSIDANQRLNKALWTLTEKMYELKTRNVG